MFNFVIQTSESTLYVGDTIFYLGSFLLLLFLIGKFAWNPVRKIMQERATKIDNDLDFASEAKERAAKLEAERKAQLQNSRAEATEIINKASATAETQSTEMIKKAQADVATLRKAAQTDIDQSKKDALVGVKDEVANMAVDIATELIKKEIDSSAQDKLIAQYVSGLEQGNEKNS